MKSYSHHPRSNAYTVELERAMDLIKERSGGRITFDYYPASSLYNMTTGSQALMNNLVQVGTFKAGYFIDKFGLVGDIANLPYNYTFEGFLAHYKDAGGFLDWAQPSYEKNGVLLLSYPLAESIGIISKKPIRKLEDMKGLLMRCVAGAAADGFKLLGATPSLISAGEIYEALQRGTVDASNTSIGSALSDKMYEPAKYYTNAKYTTAGVELAMNLSTFKSLSPDLQKIVLDSFKEADTRFFTEAPGVVLDNIKQMQAKGVTFIDLDKAELARWQAAIAPLYKTLETKYSNDWAKFAKIRDTMLN